MGAALTLTETMDVFENLSSTEADFWYLDKFRQHLLKVAHIPVRNVSFIAYDSILFCDGYLSSVTIYFKSAFCLAFCLPVF